MSLTRKEMKRINREVNHDLVRSPSFWLTMLVCVLVGSALGPLAQMWIWP